MKLLPEASRVAVGADSSACRASITSVLEQEHVAHGLAGAQVVTGALSAFGLQRNIPESYVRACPDL